MENATCVRHCILASWCPRPFFVLASPLPHTLVPFQTNEVKVNACMYAWIEKREAGWDRWSGQDRRVIVRTYDTGT